MTIKHNWLTKHKYSIIAIPGNVADQLPEQFELQQTDGSKINVKNVGRWKNHRIDQAPEAMTKVCFGITANQMMALLHRKWPELTRQPLDNQLISYVAVEKL